MHTNIKRAMVTRTEGAQKWAEANADKLGAVLGAGVFATVFEDANDPASVWKIGGSHSKDGGLDYAKMCARLDGSNPHFPVVHDLICGDGFYVVHMERLIPYPAVSASLEWEAAHEQRTEQISRLLNGLKYDVKALNRKLVAAAAEIRFMFGDEWGFDVHRENAMYRKVDGGYVLVITDPVSWESGIGRVRPTEVIAAVPTNTPPAPVPPAPLVVNSTALTASGAGALAGRKALGEWMRAGENLIWADLPGDATAWEALYLALTETPDACAVNAVAAALEGVKVSPDIARRLQAFAATLGGAFLWDAQPEGFEPWYRLHNAARDMQEV